MKCDPLRDEDPAMLSDACSSTHIFLNNPLGIPWAQKNSIGRANSVFEYDILIRLHPKSGLVVFSCLLTMFIMQPVPLMPASAVRLPAT
jgi:hypothetical protein